MKWRCGIRDVTEQAKWYDNKFQAIGGVWRTSPEEWDQHLTRMGFPRDWKASILDIGCGDGAFLFRAATQRGIECGMGVDLSGLAIEWALDKREELKLPIYFIREDAAVWLGKLAPEGWDFVVSLGSIEHCLRIECVLRQVKRVLKPEGKWYFYVPTDKWVHEDQPAERTAAPEEWIELFGSCGLRTDGHEVLGDNVAVWGGKR